MLFQTKHAQVGLLGRELPEGLSMWKATTQTHLQHCGEKEEKDPAAPALLLPREMIKTKSKTTRDVQHCLARSEHGLPSLPL